MGALRGCPIIRAHGKSIKNKEVYSYEENYHAGYP